MQGTAQLPPVGHTTADYTCVQYLRLNNVSVCNLTYDTLIVCPSFATPPAVFVRHFPVLQIPALHFCLSFSNPAFSCPANSVTPFVAV